jgi:polygalacturonase
MNKILFASLLFFVTATYGQFSETSKVPTTNEVGVSKLTSDIAPVQAPFAMPVFKKPQFPKYEVRITGKGATEQALVTKEIQAAIDNVSQHGGGSVIVPSGKWKTGRIALKSNVNLKLEEGAELHFSGKIEDYQPAVFTLSEGVEMMSLGAMIYANGQENIAITGKGKIVGPSDSVMKPQESKGTVIENIISADMPVNERIFDGKNNGRIFYPLCISPVNCKNIYIEGITINNSLFWNIVPIYCDGVVIRGITVNSKGGRTDGIDIQSTRNVLIEYCNLSCGDDCFTFKGGRNEDGMRVNKPSENIVVRHCLTGDGAGAVTCGSETAGMIRNVYVHDCVFYGTKAGLYFKTRRPRGGGGENLTYERIRINVPGKAISVDMMGSKTYVGELAERLPVREINRLTPVYRNVTIRDLIVEKASIFLLIVGIPESPMTGFSIENADVTSSRLISITDVKNLSIHNSVIQTPDSVIKILGCQNVLFSNVKFPKFFKTEVLGDFSDNIQFKNCIPLKPFNWNKDVFYNEEKTGK